MIWHLYDGGFWARFGKTRWGISIVDKRKHPPLFSERGGYRRIFRVYNYGFEILKPLEDK